MTISIVVPCYNEEEALPAFWREASGVAAQMPEATFEFLFVNDGSKDGTLALLTQLAKEDSRSRVLNFARNAGKEAGLLAGLANATGDYVAVMDADLQDPPALLPKMLSMIQETGCDCVATRRVSREGEPPIRSLFARTFYKLMPFFTQVPIVSGARDFRLMSREMVDAILRLTEKRRFSKGLFAWVGFDVQYIAYENIERVAGETKWSFWGLLRYALEGVFSLSSTPLALPLLFAILCGITAIVLLCLGMGRAALIIGLGAVVLACIYIFGQYLARVYWEAKKRPLYISRKQK